jgi:hypothetical protein
MKYEVNGRNDFEKDSLDAVDLQITGIASDHVKVRNLDPDQKVIYAVGDTFPPVNPSPPPATLPFPTGWEELLPGQEKTVRMDGETQINFRKKVFYRNILRNPDNSTRLNDVTVTIRVDEVDLT